MAFKYLSPKMTAIEDNVIKTSFNDLNEYVMIKIFGYLSVSQRINLSVVSLKWKNCIEKSFKSQFVLNSFTFDLDNYIEELKIYSSYYSYSYSYIQSICKMIQKCCNVKHISLKGTDCIPGIDCMAGISSNAKIDEIIDTIVSNSFQLQSIDFGNFSYNQEFKNPHNFRSLRKITSSKFGEIALNSIIDSENLECIDIRDNFWTKKLDLKRLGPKIIELNLFKSGVFEYNVIKELTEGNGIRIEKLVIDIKEKNVLPLICNNLLKLKVLAFWLHSENCDFNRFSNLKDLKSLQIKVMDSSDLKCQEFTDLVRSLKYSRIITLIVDLPKNSTAINDQTFQEILINCPLIENLVIRGANSLTGIGFYAISQMKNIKHLNLKDCENISDEIIFVITSCPLLRKLILHNCSYITKSTVDAFIAKAKELPKEEFYLDVIDTNVSQESLPIVVERPENLKLLYDYNQCIYKCDHRHYDDHDNWGLCYNDVWSDGNSD